MSVRMRVTKGHTGNRRSHHKIQLPRLSKCSNCGAYHIRHRLCETCGYYRGRQVIDIVKEENKEGKKQIAESSEGSGADTDREGN